MQDFGTKANDTAGPSGQLSAEEFNNLASELENSVTKSGQGLTGGSDTQLATSLFLHGVKAASFQDSGSANTYVATPVSGLSGVVLPQTYTPMNGSVVLMRAAASNSGASTMNIGQTTGALIGAKAIVDQSGSALSGGEIVAGSYIHLRYDASLSAGAGAWVLLPWGRSASQSSRGLIEIADAAEAQAWSSFLVALTPGGLDAAFKGANQVMSSSNGYQKYPGGLIHIYGTITVSGGAFSTFNYPLTLPNGVLFRAASWVSGTYSSASKGGILFGTATNTSTPIGVTDASGTFQLGVTIFGF